jgi:hypothetical protein
MMMTRLPFIIIYGCGRPLHPNLNGYNRKERKVFINCQNFAPFGRTLYSLR